MGKRRRAVDAAHRLNPNAEFWRGQRVLLTGHTGFKGAWLALWLKRLGAEVFGYSLPPDHEPNLHAMLPPEAGLAGAYGDILDKPALAEVIARCDPTITIHLAAQSLVRRSYRDPVATFETNVMGVVKVLDALRDRSALRAILIATTDKVYRNLERGRAFSEADPLGGHDPYSASKAACEIAAASWATSFFHGANTSLVTARAGNVIGGGDWADDRLVPDIWRAAQADEAVVLRYPGATRPWQHVLEPLSGYLLHLEAAAAGSAPSALNFGPDPCDVRTVEDLTSAMLQAMGSRAGWVAPPAPTFAEAQTLSLNSDLAAKAVGWRPRLDSAQAIAWTAEWYGRHAAGEAARTLCLEQIERYETLS